MRVNVIFLNFSSTEKYKNLLSEYLNSEIYKNFKYRSVFYDLKGNTLKSLARTSYGYRADDVEKYCLQQMSDEGDLTVIITDVAITNDGTKEEMMVCSDKFLIISDSFATHKKPNKTLFEYIVLSTIFGLRNIINSV